MVRVRPSASYLTSALELWYQGDVMKKWFARFLLVGLVLFTAVMDFAIWRQLATPDESMVSKVIWAVMVGGFSLVPFSVVALVLMRAAGWEPGDLLRGLSGRGGENSDL